MLTTVDTFAAAAAAAEELGNTVRTLVGKYLLFFFHCPAIEPVMNFTLWGQIPEGKDARKKVHF